MTVASAAQTIPRRPEGAAAPLSFAQERLLLLEQLTPGLTTYNVPRILRVGGRLDQDALRNAFEVVVERHEPLRTTVELVAGTPVQRVGAPPAFELPVVDLTREADAETRAASLVDDLAWRPFDLERGPLLRALLLRLVGEDRLAVVCHHLTSDFASASILVNELAEAYAAVEDGREPALAELPIAYADYAAWQRGRLDGPGLQRSLAYWRERLRGAPERIDLPADHPRPAVKTYRGGSRLRPLDPDVGEDVRALARANSVSPFVVLLAAFSTLLFRYTDSDDVVVGTVATGRQYEETLSLIGLFANTLVLRTDLSGEPTFAELLARAKETAFGAFAHQEVPFEKLVEELNPTRDLSHSPLFQVMFAYDVDAAVPAFGGRPVTVEGVEARWARFDLAVEARQRTDGGIDLEAEYSSDLFEPETIDRFLGHFETLLRGAIADPHRSITTLPLLTGDERRRLLDEWNATMRPLPEACLHELVSRTAAERPEAVAVEGGGRQITYGQLESDSNRLATHLRSLGVTEGSLVAVCLERVPEQLVAFLGVLKTGAAYVPADPTYPPARLQAILEDSAAPVVVTQEALLDRLPRAGTTVVCLDRDRSAIEAHPDAPVHSPTDSARLAYVIYTSGSTGRPKGVEIRHRSVVNLLASMQERPGLSADDVVVNVTTSAFDLSVPDLYLPLVYGARLMVLPAEVAQDGRRLADALDDAEATFVQATGTTWSLLVESGWTGRPGMKIVCGGEALPRALAEQLLGLGAELWHMYGPTETTVWSSSLRLARGEGAPPIGGPIANTRFYVVDRHLQALPVGVPGELLIGGAGVARGYRNRPELTADRFVADPFRDDADARVYRTGDSMRWRPDGTLEFIGRLDQQVKLHGFRIELGEIESLLDRHPEVRASVATVRADAGSDKLLVAYAVLQTAAAVTPEALRRYLAASLPGYMVPSVIVILDELPVTANGKLDRAALPAPGVVREELGEPYVAPRTPLEQQLTAIWEELLPVDRVGIDDDFFDLGGQSMLALRLVARIQEAFAVDLFLTAVFEHSTVRGLAAHVTERLLGDAGDDELAALLDELEVAGT